MHGKRKSISIIYIKSITFNCVQLKRKTKMACHFSPRSIPFPHFLFIYLFLFLKTLCGPLCLSHVNIKKKREAKIHKKNKNKK
jgi:hypothetical protein